MTISQQLKSRQRTRNKKMYMDPYIYNEFILSLLNILFKQTNNIKITHDTFIDFVRHLSSFHK